MNRLFSQRARSVTRRVVLMAVSGAALGGCSTPPVWLPTSGPTITQVQAVAPSKGVDGIQLVEINDFVARRLLAARKQDLFSDAFGPAKPVGYNIGSGDVVEISVWEAPPATLFGGGSTSDVRSGPATTRVTTFPEQMVNSDGTINMPFAGQIEAAGRNPQQIERDIAQRLKGKANQAQVLVRVIRNVSNNVTIVGEVSTSTRMPLTSRGERLLDALAAAGGVRQPVDRMTLQLTRGTQVRALPLQTVIRDAAQNINLQPGDVITALNQPLSFTVLGATGKNEEINFEAQGISITQALARAGGLQDTRADARGVFVFRFEDEKALDWPSRVLTTPDGKVPVIYQLDLKDPASFFAAQSFMIQSKDLLFVSNAPAAELQKFLNIVSAVAAPVLGAASIINVTR